jgi:hypothetical protein
VPLVYIMVQMSDLFFSGRSSWWEPPYKCASQEFVHYMICL